MFGYQELVELLPLEEGTLLLAVSAGWVHVLDVARGRARRTQQLRYFGRGKGRGLMAFGLTEGLDGALYFAEYVTESGERPTAIWKSTDRGETWAIAYEFPAGMVRHVHVVQCDPHDGALWIGSGDRDVWHRQRRAERDGRRGDRQHPPRSHAGHRSKTM